ncbi:MAG TPA: flagellar basal body L-ring protein FlgH [Novimethylophilus sp.]|jgi:flagellar L-ring protein precursor FlgH|uniref:flagellar basal body L-ring protein FlgH n=1 Tax=Novimethylophilus sp. TaxID=2137426 RepID=UPI002F42BF01
MNGLRNCSILLALLVLAGCNTDPSTSVRQPMTIRPNPQPPAAQADGAIYHAANSRPLFEDRRARFVGDTLTVTLVEKTAGSTSSADNSNHTGSAAVNIGTPTILGYTPRGPFSVPLPGGNNNFGNQTNLNTRFTANSAIKSDNKDSNSNSNSFTGSITVTVIEVLPNGNLMVSGEKQIAINNNAEFIRLSGVVNPVNITSGNVVSSTQLADARIENKEKQSMDTAQIVSMLSRFFVALLPF